MAEEHLIDQLSEHFPDIADHYLNAYAQPVQGDWGDSMSGREMAHIEAMRQAVAGDSDTPTVSLFRVGETVINTDQGQVAVSAPIAHNVWYLVMVENLFNLQNPSEEEMFIHQAILRLQKECGSTDIFRQHWNWEDALYGVGRVSCKKMRYESWAGTGSPLYPSAGPDEFDYKAEGAASPSMFSQYGAYIAFPVGPLGVMEYLTVFSLSLAEYPDSLPHPSAKTPGDADTTKALNGLMSPKKRLGSQPWGVAVSEKGYLRGNADAELVSQDFPGQPVASMHEWLRFWVRRDAQWPVPGEFVCMIAQAYPYHVWWHQESNPFIYSGHFFETAAYTSGEVEGIIEAEDIELINGATSEEEAPIYKVQIQGVEVVLRTTDFYRYEIGQQVAVVKKDLSARRQWASWLDVFDAIAYEKSKTPDLPPGAYEVHEDFVIAPIDFYRPQEV